MNQKIDTSLVRFVEEAKRFPMLSPEREQALARAWRDRQDRDALQQLVGSHLRLVVKIARGFTGYGLPLADLVAEGNVGMMQAAEKFDPDRGFRFATYAMWWIRASIQEYILHSWSLVKMGTTAAQKKLFFNLRKLKGQMAELEQGDLPPEAVTKIATELDVPEAEVIEMNRRLAGADNSLNALVGGPGSDGDSDFLDRHVADAEANPLAQLQDERMRAALVEAIKVLPEREQYVMSMYYEHDMNLKEIAAVLGITESRVCQLHSQSIARLRAKMRSH